MRHISGETREVGYNLWKANTPMVVALLVSESKRLVSRTITLSCMLCALLSCAPDNALPPNILLISMDTVRSDHCSVYGYHADTTPHLQRVSENGACFDLAYSPTSTTGPTHASLFTSLYPMHHGVIKNGLNLEDRFTTLAERLQDDGYQTAAVISSFVLDQKFGYGQGFEFYDDDLDWESSKTSVSSWEGHAVEHGFDRPGDEVTRRALQWLDGNRDDKRGFFLFLHYFDAHAPYLPPAALSTRFTPSDASPGSLEHEMGSYDGGIAFIDAQIGQLLDWLEQEQLDSNTIVVIVGDHGEGLGQHGEMRHGASVHEEVVRVPLLLMWPNRIRAGQRFASPTELLDLAPTLYELVGIDHEAADLKGRNLAPALRGEVPYEARDRPVFLFRRHYDAGSLPGVRGMAYAVREGDWKYVYGPDEKRKELYNLREDPGELQNVLTKRPHTWTRLHERLEEWRSLNSAALSDVPAISQEDREALQALGYVE